MKFLYQKFCIENNKNLKKLLYIYIIVNSFFVYSQKNEELDSIPPNFDDYILVKPGDSITIKLNEITLLPKQKFKSKVDVRYYLWFRRKVFKAYPFAKLASERLDSLNARLERIDSKRKRRKYTKQVQKYIEGEFMDQIKKMTKTEGRLLIKLIHRQTGKTAFNNIKGLRSGWKAFWYNTTANLFKLSLKDEYHPETINEDYLIEDILQRSFLQGKLEEQEARLALDYLEMVPKYKNIDSRILLRDVYSLITSKHYKLVNCDCTIVAQNPKMSPHIEAMRKNLAEDLESESNQISVKATTTEKLGFTGKEEGIAVYAVVLLEK